MYLPKSLQIASPYVSRWYGESGRQYEFGVVRSASFRIDEPAVYVLAKHEGNIIVPLSVGQTEGGRMGPNGGTPSEWVQALAEGMTHAHLRFEAQSEAFRHAEVQDLVLALRPLLNEVRTSESDLIRLSPDRPLEDAAASGRFSPSEADSVTIKSVLAARKQDALPEVFALYDDLVGRPIGPTFEQRESERLAAVFQTGIDDQSL
jgi:hypothetical protein